MDFKSHNIRRDYNILLNSGFGTYGSVFKAINKKTSKYVAVKFFNNMIEKNDHIHFTNFQEINFLIMLAKCKYIIDISAVYSYKRRGKFKLCVVMPYYNMTLRTWINESHKIPVHKCMVMMMIIIKKIIMGIHYMHSKGIIHCDIKPANVLLSYKPGVLDIKDADVDVRIVDFGLSRFSGNINRIYDADGSDVHVLNYRAPEIQRRNNNFYHYSVDIWALGCVIADMNIRHGLLFNVLDDAEYKLYLKNLDSILDEKITNKFYNVVLKKILIKSMRKRPDICAVGRVFGMNLGDIERSNSKEIERMSNLIKFDNSRLDFSNHENRLKIINHIVLLLVDLNYANSEVIYGAVYLVDRIFYNSAYVCDSNDDILMVDICCLVAAGFIDYQEPSMNLWMKHIQKHVDVKQIYEMIMIVLQIEDFEIYKLLPMQYMVKYDEEIIFNLLLMLCDVNYLKMSPVAIFKVARKIRYHGDDYDVIGSILCRIGDYVHMYGEFYLLNFMSDDFKIKYNI